MASVPLASVPLASIPLASIPLEPKMGIIDHVKKVFGYTKGGNMEGKGVSLSISPETIHGRCCRKRGLGQMDWFDTAAAALFPAHIKNTPFPLSPLLLLSFSALLCAMLFIMSRRRARRERGAEKTFPPSPSNPSSLEERGLLRLTNFFEREEKKGPNWDMGGMRGAERGRHSQR